MLLFVSVHAAVCVCVVACCFGVVVQVKRVSLHYTCFVFFVLPLLLMYQFYMLSLLLLRTEYLLRVGVAAAKLLLNYLYHILSLLLRL